MARKTLLFLFSLVVTLTFMSIAYSQTGKNTVRLPNGELVCDLNGEWNTLYEPYRPMQHFGNMKSMIKITQQGNMFVGKSMIDTGFTPAGTEKIRGELDRDGIKKLQLTRPDKDWSDGKVEMSRDCNKIIIDDSDGLKMTLERK
ncbi:MAG TPA: hypothetical protein VF343_00875 [Syntrophales bacterium]